MSAFTNWSQLADDPARNTCSPNLLALSAHLRARHGGQVLGCYAERNIRGGESPSAHSHGAALDWRYENPGPGRPAALALAQWVIDNAAVLGVQAIHDYVGARIWHCDRNAWKAAAKRSNGTYIDPNMGQPWAQWFHFETTLAAWADARPIAQRITPQSTPEEDDDDMLTKRYRDRRYNNIWLIPAKLHLSGEADAAYAADGVPLIEGEHEQMLDDLLHASGLTRDRLVPR